MFDNKLKLLAVVFAVVLVSGCVNSGKEVVEASHDVLKFGEIITIPVPPVFAGDTFSTTFQIENLDEFEDAKDVELTLYDWGVCKPKSCEPKSDEWGFPTIKTSYTKKFGEILPRDIQFIDCNFQAPSQEEIAGLKSSCPIKFKLSYEFSGTTTTDLTVISDDKYRDLQKSGEIPTVTSTETKSRGPIKVDFEFLTDQPVRTSADKKIPMYIRIENKGEGEIQKANNKNKIELSILIPNDLLAECSDSICGDWFSASKEGNNCKLTMTAGKEIEFVKGKSEPIRCELVSPKGCSDTVTKDCVKDEKTYYISSEVTYTYQIDKKTNVAIKPIKVV